MKRRILSLILFAAMAISMICPVIAANSGTKAASDQRNAIVYIPLDDRPLSLSRVQQLADSLDLTLILPDQDLFATKLDGQGKNANGTQYGDRAALLTWLMEQAAQYDTFILSLDQLLSGGLMNSRCMTDMEPIVLPDGREMTEYDVIDYIASLSKTKHVYVIDSIMRIALSSGYGGYGIDAYSLTRSYGMKARQVLTGSELTVDNIIRNYTNCIPGQDDAADDETAGDENELINQLGLATVLEAERRTAVVTQVDQDAVLAQYLKIRERKLRLVDYAVKKLGVQKHVEYVLGVDDSSAGNNVHTNEIAYVQKVAGDRITILSALDGIAQMILSRYYGEQTGSQGTTLGVQYFGFEQDWVPSFNYMTVSELVESTAAYMNAEISKEYGDISLLMVASSSDSEKNRTVFTQLINQINQNEADGIPTILLDFAGKDNDVLYEMLTDSVHLGYLLSFSGAYDNVIQVPMALSYGISRYRSMFQTLSQKAEYAQAETIVTSLVEEYYKSCGVASSISQELAKLGVNSNNFATTDQKKLSNYQQLLNRKMQQGIGDLIINFEQSNTIVSMEPYSSAAIFRVGALDFSFPWNRTFEIDFDVSCSQADSANVYVYHPAYIQGMGDAMFRPMDALSRSQAAKMLVAVTDTPMDDSEVCPFDDVASWASPYVAAAYARGYMRGYGNGSFRGNDSITRVEFVAMLAQYAKAENIKLEQQTDITFNDVPEDGQAWYTENVYLLAHAGIINGYSDGTFRPNAKVTRTEAVVMLGRMFGRTDSAPDWTQEFSIFRDVSTKFWGYSAIAEASIGHFTF